MMDNTDQQFVSAYENGRKALEPEVDYSFGAGGNGPYVFNQASGRPDYLMAFSVRFLRRKNSGKPELPAPRADQLRPGEKKGCATLFEVLTADNWGISELMTDRPRIAEEIYGLFKSQHQGVQDLSTIDHACETRLAAGGFDVLENALACAVRIMKSDAEADARKRSARSGPSSITSTEPAFLEWQTASPDPDLWHQMLRVLNYALQGNVDFLYWLVRQPDCDRATAAALFLMLHGHHMVGMPRDAVEARFPGSLVVELCARAEGEGFKRHELSLQYLGFANDQRPMIAEMQALYAQRSAQSVNAVPVPVALFSEPLSGRRPQSHYYAHSENLVTLDA